MLEFLENSLSLITVTMSRALTHTYTLTVVYIFLLYNPLFFVDCHDFEERISEKQRSEILFLSSGIDYIIAVIFRISN